MYIFKVKVSVFVIETVGSLKMNNGLRHLQWIISGFFSAHHNYQPKKSVSFRCVFFGVGSNFLWSGSDPENSDLGASSLDNSEALRGEREKQNDDEGSNDSQHTGRLCI